MTFEIDEATKKAIANISKQEAALDNAVQLRLNLLLIRDFINLLLEIEKK